MKLEASITAVPIMVLTEMRTGSMTFVPATGASQALMSLFSAMNFVLGLSALCPAIGT